jgi:hypothetical protein
MTHLRDARNFSSAALRDTGTDTGKVRDAADTLTQTNADEWRLPRLSKEGGIFRGCAGSSKRLRYVAPSLPPCSRSRLVSRMPTAAQIWNLRASRNGTHWLRALQSS